MKSAVAITGFLLVVCACVFLPLKWGIWLPDLIQRKANTLAEFTTTNGDHLRLTQLWVGDGYATEFFHTDKNGKIWTFAIDGDAGKAWTGSLEKTNHLVRISILKAVFLYDMQSNVVTDRDGKQQMVEEIPRSTPTVPPR